MREYDAIVLGAGAAGLMCASVAGRRGQRVLVLDHAERAGKKILISGGGRCNFTNVGTVPERFISANPHFARSALGRYRPEDFIALVDAYGIAWHEKTLGQLFCDGSARQIVAMLLAECARGQVDIRTGHRITGVHGGNGFRVETDHGDFAAPKLVLATGGPSIPKMGASGFAYDIARSFGLAVVAPRPALVPLTLDDLGWAGISGVAVDAVVTCAGERFREAMLFTHRGLSGPAILQISSYWSPGDKIVADLLPGLDLRTRLLAAKRERPRVEIHTALGELLPARLAALLTDRLGLGGRLGILPDRRLADAAANLGAWAFTPTGSEGFAKAEVTAGGIDTADLSQKTMEARSVPGLFVIGEAVDVTGWLGGYNFQWAWASGWCAGTVL